MFLIGQRARQRSRMFRRDQSVPMTSSCADEYDSSSSSCRRCYCVLEKRKKRRRRIISQKNNRKKSSSCQCGCKGMSAKQRHFTMLSDNSSSDACTGNCGSTNQNDSFRETELWSDESNATSTFTKKANCQTYVSSSCSSNCNRNDKEHVMSIKTSDIESCPKKSSVLIEANTPVKSQRTDLTGSQSETSSCFPSCLCLGLCDNVQQPEKETKLLRNILALSCEDVVNDEWTESSVACTGSLAETGARKSAKISIMERYNEDMNTSEDTQPTCMSPNDIIKCSTNVQRCLPSAQGAGCVEEYSMESCSLQSSLDGSSTPIIDDLHLTVNF